MPPDGTAASRPKNNGGEPPVIRRAEPDRIGAMGTRWQSSDAPRGQDYDARWERLAASGVGVHGEADLIESLLRETDGSAVLDAGCGTGRVAIELAARGFAVVDSTPTRRCWRPPGPRHPICAG